MISSKKVAFGLSVHQGRGQRWLSWQLLWEHLAPRELISQLWGFLTCLGANGEAFLLRGHPLEGQCP